MRRIGVIIKEPGRDPRHVNISDSLENLQRTVGGYIEAVTLGKARDGNDRIVAICNEEGRIRGLPYCCTILGIDFFGPVILVGACRDEFTDWPFSFDKTKELLPLLWGV